MKLKDSTKRALIFLLILNVIVWTLVFIYSPVIHADGLGATEYIPLDNDIVVANGGNYLFGIDNPVVFHSPKANSHANIWFLTSQFSTGSLVTITRDKLPGSGSYGNNIAVPAEYFSIVSGGRTYTSLGTNYIGFTSENYVLTLLFESAPDSTYTKLFATDLTYDSNVNKVDVTYTIEFSSPQIQFGNGVGASTEFDVASISASTVNVPAGYTAIFYRPSGNIGNFTAKLSASDFYPKPGFSDYVNGVTIFDTMEPQYLQSAYPINQVVWDTKFAGKTGSYIYLTQNSSAPFVQLVNPLFSQNSDLTKPNPTVKVEYPAGFVVKLFSLTYNSDRSSEVLASSSAVNYVPENMIFEDPSTGGQVNNPSTGGNSEDLIYDGGETVNLLQNLSNLFTPGINAVSELVSRATGFFTALGTMFSWLPDEVFTVVISALSILIIVGAIKLFL